MLDNCFDAKTDRAIIPPWKVHVPIPFDVPNKSFPSKPDDKPLAAKPGKRYKMLGSWISIPDKNIVELSIDVILKFGIKTTEITLAACENG